MSGFSISLHGQRIMARPEMEYHKTQEIDPRRTKEIKSGTCIGSGETELMLPDVCTQQNRERTSHV